MNILLNNWNATPHKAIYGGHAFYDLYHADTSNVTPSTARQEHDKAKLMKRGDMCHVISYDRVTDEVTLRSYVLHEVKFQRQGDQPMWVMHGMFTGGYIMPRREAPKHSFMRKFFDVRGHACQWSCKMEVEL